MTAVAAARAPHKAGSPAQAPIDRYLLESGALTFRPDLTLNRVETISLPVNYDGVVFDVDGTLVDSEPHLRRGVFCCLEKVIREISGDAAFRLIDDEKGLITKNCMGVSEAEMGERLHKWIRNYLNQHHGDSGYIGHCTPEEFTHNLLQARIGEFRRAGESGEMVTMAGAGPLIVKLYGQFGSMAINTGSVRMFADISIDVVVDAELRRFGLTSKEVFPDHLRTYSDMLPATIGSKPHPHGYQRAIELLRDQREIQRGSDGLWNVLVFGDRANDMVAGLSAYCRTFVAVPEEQRLTPFLEGKFSVPAYCSSLPGGSGLAASSRILLASSLQAVRVRSSSPGLFDRVFEGVVVPDYNA